VNATSKKLSYVTAFTGRRDSYQLPVALAEHGRLAAFATCFYRDRGLAGRLARLFPRRRSPSHQRHAAGLEQVSIETMEFTNLAARLGRRLMQASKVAVWEDNAFARRAVALARAHRASLLLYEFQADWAFRQPMKHTAARILFQFHPHPDLEHPLLIADGERYPQFLPDIRRNTRANLSLRYREHTRSAWLHADHVIVASHFTAHSLHAAGCPADKITVVPYGCNFRAAPAGLGGGGSNGEGRPCFLYVGSGSQRKGLHHLLEAWGASRASGTHELIIIARQVEPELRSALARTKAVRHLTGVDGDELVRWYARARALVLPTLSEGFGHVFLEALACGCPVIGTRNSMLPDFAEAQAHIRYVEPGNVESIRAEIDRVANLSAADPFFDTTQVRASVRNYTWDRFRGGIEAVLSRFD